MVLEFIMHVSCPEIYCMNESRVAFPFSRERYDLMTYRYPFDDLSSSSGFFYDSVMRHLVAKRKMNEHDW